MGHTYIIFIYLFFNWRKIALQHCIGFCCITMQISHNYTYLSLSRLPHLPPSHSFRLLQNARMGSLCYIVTCHQLSILHVIVYICQSYFLHLSHFFLLPLHHKSVLYVCVSISSLQIGSSISFFLDYIYICTNTLCLFFLFDLFYSV